MSCQSPVLAALSTVMLINITFNLEPGKFSERKLLTTYSTQPFQVYSYTPTSEHNHKVTATLTRSMAPGRSEPTSPRVARRAGSGKLLELERGGTVVADGLGKALNELS